MRPGCDLKLAFLGLVLASPAMMRVNTHLDSIGELELMSQCDGHGVQVVQSTHQLCIFRRLSTNQKTLSHGLACKHHGTP